MPVPIRYRAMRDNQYQRLGAQEVPIGWGEPCGVLALYMSDRSSGPMFSETLSFECDFWLPSPSWAEKDRGG